ncbi:hypothetical protein DAPPUDRAFT_103858 [Daphnia pulex]|uniref:Uncharacterized protein n=1 Tax=Daphnia pulex TaxID=6669 RepID=E9GKJ7_DAPPU|nr:hypothetical protein DAPPUDRAFT_120476 [Daphnia pulex]EFX80053.1 hypothetical protein DAPPUDRAFT_103858 [Daphnia pulex]|eukprot:EFX62150.1 hypothetical protein DAPPUDRAFT_120476 [Daphnia pulex]
MEYRLSPVFFWVEMQISAPGFLFSLGIDKRFSFLSMYFMLAINRSRKVSKSSSKIGKRTQRIKRALLRKAGVLPAWVEPPPRPPPREPIPLDQLPPGALAPHLAPILGIARRHLNAEQLADAIRPRFWGDHRYRPEEEPAPQPVPPPAQDLLPVVVEEPEADQEPIQAPPPDIEQRQVRHREQHVGRGLLRRVVYLPERQEEAAAAAAPKEESESESEEDGIQLCHESSSEESTDVTSTDEDRRHFEIELEANPALRRAYERSETARRERGRFNARPGHLCTRRNTRGREQRSPSI